MTIIVVGASGAVGRLLVPHWRNTGVQVALQVRRTPPGWNKSCCFRWDPDIGPDALERWVSKNGASSCMIILAGVTPRSGRDMSLNAQIAETCLDAARRVGTPRAIVASSSAVYGDYLDRPFTELDDPRPANEYGRAKLAMERACERLSRPAFQVTCLRLGNVAGADALLSQVGASESKQILIDQFADGGTPLRSYIGPGTLADALLQLASYDEPLPPVLNVAAPAPVEMASLANAAGIRWHPRPRPEWSGQRITLDCARLWGMLSPPSGISEPREMLRQLEASGKAQ